MTTNTLNIILVLIAMLAAFPVFTQPRNLLQNPTADLQAQFWQTHGETAIGTSTGNNPCFVVRNGGYFVQEVTLPNDAVGKYALLIGRGSSG
ncbi:MAG TPA: hypothetical protein VFV34_06185, partial [Blastocatellia bacterium]|nr:hypothetical protein [Blastocatellia bacterium]